MTTMKIGMETRYATHPEHVKHYDTASLRANFLIEKIFQHNQIKMVYSHEDRAVIGGAFPVEQELTLVSSKELSTPNFLDRREIGIFNLGGDGTIKIDNQIYELANQDCLYIGKEGGKQILFNSASKDTPAKFYFNSAPAHKSYPTVKRGIQHEGIEKATIGESEKSNVRSLYKFIFNGGIDSCQLVMGITVSEPGSAWNSMPCHVHERRMEVYFYFDMDPKEGTVFHFMGKSNETRHIIMRNEQAVISPNWSIHTGAGLGPYKFIWSMLGENQDFNDMDHVPMMELK